MANEPTHAATGDDRAMSRSARLARSLRELASSAAAGLLLSLLLQFLPLLDGLTYEYAVVVALATFALGSGLGSSAALALEAPYRLRWKLLDADPRQRLEPALRSATLRTVVFALAHVWVPAARGAWLGCAVERGLPIFLLTALPAAVLGVAAGVFARVLAPGRNSRGRWRRAGIVALLVLVSAALTAVELLFGPLAIFHNLVIGQVAATGYLGFDDAVRLPGDQILHRMVSLVVAAQLLAIGLAVAAARGRAAVDSDVARVELLLRDEARGARRRALLVAVLLLGMALVGDPFGLGSGRGRVERVLSGRLEGANLELRFRPGSRAEALAPLLLEDSEWALARVRRELGLASPSGLPERTTRIFVYADPAEQARLTGASGYLFAKPWLGEVHTRLDEDGELVALRHELAHVVAAGFGLPLLRVSWRYGLIEGLAEAVGGEYRERRYRHEPAAAALRKGLLPPARIAIGSLGFASRDAEVSYLAAASFTGWLLGAEGAERLRRVYAWGDFEQVYRTDLDTLDLRWRNFLRGVPVERSTLAWAARAFDVEQSPPFFRRACARVGLRDPSSRDPAPACVSTEALARIAALAAAGPDPDPELRRLRREAEAELVGLDQAAARGPLAARESALVSLAAAFARRDRLEEGAEALARRVALAALAGRRAPLSAAAAADPLLVPFALAAAGSLELGELGARAFPEHGSDPGAQRVIALGLALRRRENAETLHALARVVGGCGEELAMVESALLRRTARALVVAGAREQALAGAMSARSIASAGEEEAFEAELLVDRLTFPGGQSHLN